MWNVVGLVDLGIDPGEVDGQLIAFDDRGEHELHRLAQTFVNLFGAVTAVGDGADEIAHRLSGLPLQMPVVALHGVAAEPGKQREQALFAAPAGRRRRIEVAQHVVGCAHVGADYLAYRLIGPAAVIKLHCRQPQSFLVDLLALQTHAAGEAPADIGMMLRHRRKSAVFALMEQRHDHDDIGQVRPAAEWIVADDDVARLEDAVFGDHIGQRLDEISHPVGQRLNNHVALEVKQRGGEVAPFLGRQRARGLPHGDVHLLGNGNQLMAHHLDQNRIDIRGQMDILVAHGRYFRRRQACA